MENDFLVRRGEADFDFYPYNPSKNAGAAFLALFTVMTSVHLVQVFMYRSWFFIVFTLGCAGKPTTETPHKHRTKTPQAEAGGCYGRMQAHNNIRQSDPFLIQLFLILGAVPLISASIYMSYSRVVRALEAEGHSLVRVSWVSKLYVLIDVACLVLQVMGTVMQAYGDDGIRENSIYYIAGGLIFQLVAFVVFVLLFLRIHVCVRKEATGPSDQPKVHWRRVMWAIYITSALIVVRNAVRIVEFLQGEDSSIAADETHLYVLDATPMLLVVIALAVAHPGRLIRSCRRRLRTRGSSDGVTLLDGRCESLPNEGTVLASAGSRAVSQRAPPDPFCRTVAN